MFVSFSACLRDEDILTKGVKSAKCRGHLDASSYLQTSSTTVDNEGLCISSYTSSRLTQGSGNINDSCNEKRSIILSPFTPCRYGR